MPDNESESIRRRKPWFLSFFGLLAAAGLVALPFLAGPPDGEKMPDIVRFIGHFHPLVLHLPIGVFTLIVIQELGAIFGRRRPGGTTSPVMFPLFFGAASAFLAVLTGFFLYQGSDDYAGNAVVERHLWGGIAFAVVAIITFLLKAWTVSLGSNPAFYRLLLFGSVSVMGFASHDGGTITHGEGFLTKYAPDPVRTFLGMEPRKEKPVETKTVADQIVYTDVIAPIFENRCVQCHKEGKAKGKLRMDTYELLLVGGKEGAAFEPGDADGSNIIYRIDLPEDDEEHMPPEGKPQLTEDEIVLLKWWINSGADPVKTVGELAPPPAVLSLISLVAPMSASAPEEDAEVAETVSTGPDEDLVKSVASISAEFPGALVFESQGSDLLTFSAVSMRGNLDDAGFAKFASVIPQLVTVDLSATKITDTSVAALAGAENLRLVRLAETEITDGAIESLLELPALESLNLYGTRVTDAGVSKLSALTSLKRLYLWRTAVTPVAITALQKALPDCEIITGAE